VPEEKLWASVRSRGTVIISSKSCSSSSSIFNRGRQLKPGKHEHEDEHEHDLKNENVFL
jgi:hypothetical protein